MATIRYVRLLAEGERWHLASSFAEEPRRRRYPARCGRVETWVEVVDIPFPWGPICARCWETERVLRRPLEQVA